MKLLSLSVAVSVPAVFCAIASAAQIEGYLVDKACKRSGYFPYAPDGKVLAKPRRQHREGHSLKLF